MGKRLHPPKKPGGGARGAHAEGEGREKENGGAGAEEIDPNEPRYCLCGDVSYGEMVGCDNDDVSDCSSFFLYGYFVLTFG